MEFYCTYPWGILCVRNSPEPLISQLVFGMAMHRCDFLLAVKLCGVNCTSDLDLLALHSCQKENNHTVVTSKLL